MKNFKPFIERDGSIKGTPLQNELTLKTGAEVMLTYNIDTCDGLTNGAFGKVLGFEFDNNKVLKLVHVEFYNDTVGRQCRKKYGHYQNKFPGKKVTPIGRHESHYNIENKVFINLKGLFWI